MFRPPKVIDPKTPTVKMSEENQNIQVFVRCRPLKSTEKKSTLELIPERRAIKFAQQNKSYAFDNVFDCKSKQFDVYQSVVEPLVEQVTEGYNCTVFAYGQTGTGKTYTMAGNRSDKNVSWIDDPISGIIPRSIDQLIDSLNNQNTEYTIRVSFLELYNEDAYDLLSPLSDANKLRIYNDSERKGSVIISGLVELIVKTKEEIFEILEKGSLKRATAPTLMNACSSRSHSIFSVTVHIKEMTLEGEEVVKMGKLNLVDLAGSENIGRSGAIEERAREASNINKSLLTLGRVITSLVEKSSHIPYRDSKLTRLLQDSLGGKTKTSIIATISPSIEDIEDTISTLDYAQRAKKITNKPEINLKMSKKTLISEYLGEIDKLRRDLEAARDKKGIYVDAKNYASMEATIKDQEQNLEAKEIRIEHLQTEVDKWVELLKSETSNLNAKSKELDDLRDEFHLLNEDLQSTRDVLCATKTEVEQQKFLVMAHQTSEQKLLGQAQTIINVADKCMGDNEFLYKKIDTLSSLEDNNSKHCNQFMEDYSKQLEQIDHMNYIIFGSIKQTYESLEESILANQTIVKNKGVELQDSMKQIKSTIDTFSDKLIDLFQNEMVITKSADTLKQTLSAFKSDLTGKIENSFASFQQNEKESMNALEALTADSLKSRANLEELVMSEISSLNQNSKHMTASIKSIQEDLAQNYKLKCAENVILQNEVAQLRSLNANMAIKEEIQNVIKSLTQISNKYDESLRQNSVSLVSLNDCLEKAASNETKNLNGLSFKTDELIELHEKDKSRVQTFLSEVDQHFGENCQNIIDKCVEVKQANSKIGTDYQNFSKTLTGDVEHTLNLVSDQINSQVNDVLVKSLEEQTACVTDFKSMASNLITSNTELSSNVIQKTIDNDGSTLKLYQEMQSYCNDCKSTQEHQLKDCLKIGQEFVQNNFQTYDTTGLTPKKTTYSFQRELACTSPHERIIARFKENIQRKESASIESNEESNGFSSSGEASPISVQSDSEGFVDENVIAKVEEKTFVVATNKLNGVSKAPKNKQRKLLKEQN